MIAELSQLAYLIYPVYALTRGVFSQSRDVHGSTNAVGAWMPRNGKARKGVMGYRGFPTNY